MRHASLLTAAIVMSGCAQGISPAEPATQSASAAGPAAPPVPAPADAGPCDPSIAEPVAVTDTGACPGVMPRPSSCAADVTICSGLSSGANGVSGTTVSAATSDGKGSVVLSCHRADVGPPRLNFLFVPTRAGFVSKAGLGVEARPLRDGFVVSDGSYLLPPPAWDFLAHDGDLRAAQEGGTLYGNADRALIVRLVNGELVAQPFAADGTPGAVAQIASISSPAGSLTLSGAMNAAGATLLIWQAYGDASASARWIAADGTAGTAFSIAGWTDRAPFAAALAGGAIAIAAEPQSGSNARRWRSVVASGETIERPAPAWLASRGDFFSLPDDKAMAFGNEIVDSRGTSCGTVDAGSPLVGIGVDGTAFSARSEKTFRIHPQLFR